MSTWINPTSGRPLSNDVIPICKCGSFMLYNFFFVGQRFLCLSCGTLSWDAPRLQPSTADGEAKYAVLESEFLVNCGRKLFCVGMTKIGCSRCDLGEEHIQHANTRDWMHCNDALKWLSDRTGIEFGIVNGDLGHTEFLKAKALAAQ